MPSPILLELKPSPLLLAGAVLLLCGAGCTLALAPLTPGWRLAGLASLLLSGVHAVRNLLHGRCQGALARLEWLGGPHWVLQDGRGRVRAARLGVGSRRLGRASLLIFRRGVFGRFDRPWAVVMPNMVTDASAARRLRARLTLDGEAMRSRAVA